MVLDVYSISSVVIQGSEPFLLVILHNISAEALGFPFLFQALLHPFLGHWEAQSVSQQGSVCPG